MSWTTLVSLLTLCVATLASPSVILAQDATGAAAIAVRDPDAEARDVFQRGREAYARGEYDAALAAFRDAYSLSGRAELQFNIGQTADRLRLDREARTAFRAYLDALPDATNRVEVEARLRVLDEEIARDDALRAQAAASTTTPSEPSIVEQWWFWTLIGVAVAGAGVGIGFAVGSHEELAAPTPGDVGPGGVVIALEGR